MKIELKKEFKDCAAMQASLSASGMAITEQCPCGALFLRHPRNRTKLCCVCRSIKRSEYIRKREGISGEPLPGFPREDCFSTMEEILEYTSHVKIQCLLCGRAFRALNTHIKRVHGLESAREYKLRFGIPFNVGLVGVETEKILHDVGVNIIAKADPNELKKTLQRAQDASIAAREASPIDQLHGSPALLKLKRECIRKAIESENHVANLTRLVPWECASCGTGIMAPEVSTITNGCRLLCKRCRSARHKKSQLNWMLKNGIDPKEYHAAASRRSYERKKPPHRTSYL